MDHHSNNINVVIVRTLRWAFIQIKFKNILQKLQKFMTNG